MKRTSSKLIKPPSILRKGDDGALGLNEDEIHEKNLKSYDYGKRTAIRRLEEYPINPFGNALKDIIFQKAIEEIGLDSDGYLKGNFSDSKILGNRKFFVRTYPSTSYSHEFVLSKTVDIFDRILADNMEGISKEGVRKLDGAYIWVDYLMGVMEELKNKKSSRINNKDLTILDVSTGKKAKLDESIDRMRVYFDQERYAQLIKKNADEHFNAKSLVANTRSFLKSYEEEKRKEFGIPPKELEEDIPFDFELSDGSAASYLFYPKITTKHGEIYKGIVGKTTKEIERSTGDLNIIKERAFKEKYESLKGGSGIIVSTNISKSEKKGKIKILRIYKDRQDERTYSVFDNNGRIFVKAGNILKIYEKLREKYTSSPITQVKIDFFPAEPKHLI